MDGLRRAFERGVDLNSSSAGSGGISLDGPQGTSNEFRQNAVRSAYGPFTVDHFRAYREEVPWRQVREALPVFPMDQAASAHQEVLWNIGECCQDPDMDRRVNLPADRHCKEASWAWIIPCIPCYRSCPLPSSRKSPWIKPFRSKPTQTKRPTSGNS
jgi:hypothetical protein